MMQNRSAIRRPSFLDEDPLQNPEQQALQRVFGAVGAGANAGLPTRNTGVSGGIDRGTPMPTREIIERYGSEGPGGITGRGGMGGGTATEFDTSEGPGGLSGTLERPNFQDTTLPGGPKVVSTGPNTKQPGGVPGAMPDEGTTVGAGTGAGGGRRGWAGSGGTGLNLDAPPQTGMGRFEGFNDDRALSGGDENSVKDAFRRWAGGLNFDPTTASKEEIEAALRGNLDSAAAYGLNILDVNGENILIETAERGPEWVDVVRGAGGGDAAWQWGAADDGGGAGMQTGGGLEGFGGQGLPSGLMEALLAEGGAGDDTLLQQIAAELEALTSGRPSPLTQPTLERAFGG